MEAETHDDRDVQPAESRMWALVIDLFLKTAPHPLLRAYSNHSAHAQIEQIVVTGRRTGRERRHNVSVFDIDGAMYAGHPNGPSQWTRNLDAGEATLLRRGSPPMRVRGVPLAPGAERSAAIAATGSQPFPSGMIFRGARAHIEAVGAYYRLEPIEG